MGAADLIKVPTHSQCFPEGFKKPRSQQPPIAETKEWLFLLYHLGQLGERGWGWEGGISHSSKLCWKYMEKELRIEVLSFLLGYTEKCVCEGVLYHNKTKLSTDHPKALPPPIY
jgi:hypothetical protein